MIPDFSEMLAGLFTLGVAIGVVLCAAVCGVAWGLVTLFHHLSIYWH